ncbi:MAG: DUF3471 domain-containing protein [Chitinophagaceae bacterium]
MSKSLSLLFLLLGSFCFAQAQQDSSLAEYKGVYKFKEGSAVPSVEISLQDNVLYATATIGSAELTKMAKDTFSINEQTGLMYFIRDKSGKIVSIHVEVANMVLDGTKEANPTAFIDRNRYFIAPRK